MLMRLLWSPPPADIALLSNDVHVWCAVLDQPAGRVEQLAQTLSEDEKARSDRFYFEQHRKRFIIARGLLRTILGRYLTIAPNLVNFSYGSQGKPALAEDLAVSKLQFNVSHSENLALYAVTRDRAVGIDIEYISPMADAEQLAERFFAAKEAEILRSLPENQKQQAFFNCWTRKEAYVKACGAGLSQPLNQFEVSLIPGKSANLLSIAGSTSAAAHWQLQDLKPASDYAGAMAVEGKDWQIHCWQWLE
ncbi:MAG TPA: 4'-phosphopantetheinyl transferase superfamily protein [Oculatellaceae cyanobacterium]|jgi:4'-phosphopantetheinyl transferase